MTDCRYVFQRPAEAARLQARRRYAVRKGHAQGERAATLSASPLARPGGRPPPPRPVARCPRNVLHPHVTKRTVA
ncbi:hypothetical protein DIE23_10230 [Burkholderia sp. Bp9143]|nr:hypothetical protein DIE23_10230 [Burkholderia sp. Bp9143]